jgi:hypothetical protein
MMAHRTKSMWVGLSVLTLVGGLASWAGGQELPLPYSDSVANVWGPAFEISSDRVFWMPMPPVLGDAPWSSREMYGILGRYTYVYPIFEPVGDVNIVIPGKDWVVWDPNGGTTIPGFRMGQYENVGILGGDDFGVAGMAEKGVGVYAKGGPDDYAVKADGDVLVKGRVFVQCGGTTTQVGCGFDYAEGFDVSDGNRVAPGTVLVIDPLAPGELTVSRRVYDTRVAGIAAGAKGLGSGVRLGVGRFDCDVALAGRVYCNVDATRAAVKPGDLLTTAAEPGYAMKVTDHTRAQGAILGKAMEGLGKGKKAQILVLVTLQ